MLFWRDHIASAVWSVLREAKEVYFINDESSNGKFVVFRIPCVYVTFCIVNSNYIIVRGSVRVVSGLTCCSCSVITDVLWLNLSRSPVLGAGANRNTSKVLSSRKRLVNRAYISQKQRLPPFPWWFLIRYQFLFFGMAIGCATVKPQ